MRRILVLVLALALAGAGCGSDGEVMGAAPQEAPATESGGNAEGIEVHGDWVITVVDPDGTVARRAEFSNDLNPGGQFLLVNLLTGGDAVAAWSVQITSDAGTLCGTGGCALAEPGAGGSIAAVGDLQVSTPGGNTLRLSGSAPVLADGTIDDVGTVAWGSGGSGLGVFTWTDALAEPVLAGQQIIVTVTISFS